MKPFREDLPVPQCPECKSNDQVIPILYGMPDAEAFKKAEKGEILIGGCVIADEYPEFYCKRCRLRF